MGIPSFAGVGSISRIAPILAYVILLQGASHEQALAPSAMAALGALHAVALFAPLIVADLEHGRRFFHLHLTAAALAAAAFYFRGWPMMAWICVLAGYGLGASLASRGRLERLAFTLQVLLCLVLLFFTVLPDTLRISGVAGREDLWLVTVIAFAAWAVIHAGSALDTGQSRVEPVTCMLFILLCCLMTSVTALAVLSQPQLDYLAVVLVVVVVALALSGAAWLLWAPLIGEGLSAVFFRHVLSLGVPFDDWMEEMNALAAASRDEADFWLRAMELMRERAELSGIGWSEGDEDVGVGRLEGHVVRLPVTERGLRLYSPGRVLPTRSFSLWLLARVAHEYRLSKGREERLTAEATMRSVHERGARTTHDIKNLLHAINLLCSPGRDGRDGDFGERSREQLRSLAARLETTLASLGEAGAGDEGGGLISLRAWWEGAVRRHASDAVSFRRDKDVDDGERVPAELFDRALENLLHNALRKAGRGGGLDVSVELGEGPSLTVRDSGSPIPQATASRLFRAPVPSDEGMGIGLFQLATSATGLGYGVSVASNRQGDVALRLSRLPRA